jgi:hypothetical protein
MADFKETVTLGAEREGPGGLFWIATGARGLLLPSFFFQWWLSWEVPAPYFWVVFLASRQDSLLAWQPIRRNSASVVGSFWPSWSWPFSPLGLCLWQSIPITPIKRGGPPRFSSVTRDSCRSGPAAKHMPTQGRGHATPPHCGVETVIGDHEGYVISKQFLKRLKRHGRL